MIYCRISGESDIANAMAGLSSRIQKEAAMKAVVSAVQPVVRAAKRNAMKSKRTGSLVSSLGFFIRKYRKGRKTYAVIGARRGMGVGKNEPANYAHLVEFGHMKKNGQRVEAKPFMRPAWDAYSNEAMRQLTRVFGEELKAAVLINRRKTRKRKKGIAAI